MAAGDGGDFFRDDAVCNVHGVGENSFCFRWTFFRGICLFSGVSASSSLYIRAYESAFMSELMELLRDRHRCLSSPVCSEIRVMLWVTSKNRLDQN